MAEELDGVWRTVGGRRIFIRDGEDLETAMKRSGKFKTQEQIKKEENQRKVEEKIKSTSTNMKDAKDHNSLDEHKDKDGKLSAEREKIHEEIIREYFEGKTPVEEGEEKLYYMTGGGSGTGKSNFVKNEDGKYFDKNFNYDSKNEQFKGNMIKIDADDLKQKIYAKETDGRPYSASYLHEESSALSKRINGIATDLGYNTMLDSTGDGTPDKLAGKIEEAHNKGYKVIGCYGTCNVTKALNNNYERYDKKMKMNDPTARYVSEKEVVSLHKNVTNTLIADAHLFDRVDLYDMNNYKRIQKIATGGNGKSLSVVKGKEMLYNEFVNKGKMSDDKVKKIAKSYAKQLNKSGRRPDVD